MTAFTVYLDQVFLGNMVMNYIILWAAAKISRVPVGKPGLRRSSAGSRLCSGCFITRLQPSLNNRF